MCEFLNERRIYSEGGSSENLNSVHALSPDVTASWPISPQNNGVGLNLLILKMHKWQGEAAEMSMHYALCNFDCEHTGRAPFPPESYAFSDLCIITICIITISTVSSEFVAVNLDFDLKLPVRPYALTGDSVALLSLLTLPDSGDLLSASGTRSLR